MMLNAASGGITTPLEETHRGRNELETAAAEVVIGGGWKDTGRAVIGRRPGIIAEACSTVSEQRWMLVLN